MERLIKDEKLDVMARDIISNTAELSHLADARIVYRWSDREKKRGDSYVYGECKKADDIWKQIHGYDFLIVFYAAALTLSDKAKDILMRHELMHAGYDPETSKCSIIRHDLEDFRAIINEFGADWVNL